MRALIAIPQKVGPPARGATGSPCEVPLRITNGTLLTQIIRQRSRAVMEKMGLAANAMFYSRHF
jgi:hypothetical protein